MMRVRKINRTLRMARAIDDIVAYDPSLSTETSFFIRDESMFNRVKIRMEKLAKDNDEQIEISEQTHSTIWKINLGSACEGIVVFFMKSYK